jgi:bifunctional non-homologous end joining protein LigD
MLVEPIDVSKLWRTKSNGTAIARKRHLKGKHAKVFTRQGNDWTQKFGPISEALPKLRVESAILDGEVVTLGKNGLSDFHGLRHQLGTMLPDIVYQVFDILWLDGEDLRPLAYLDRKALLKNLLRRGGEMIRYVDYVEGDGAALLKAACAMELEGIVSKRLDSATAAAPRTTGKRRNARSARRSPLPAMAWTTTAGSTASCSAEPMAVLALCRRRRSRRLAPATWPSSSGDCRPSRSPLPAH